MSGFHKYIEQKARISWSVYICDLAMVTIFRANVRSEIDRLV